MKVRMVTAAAVLASATVGLFGLHEVWTGVAVLTAGASELVAPPAGSS